MPRILARAVLFSAALVVAACGSSPTSPIARDTGGTPLTAAQASSRPVRLRGPASRLAGACPTLTFAIFGTLVSTNGSTTFPGGGCASIADGVYVVVVGTPASDGSIVATSVRVPVVPAPVTQIRGAVAGLAGTCPSITFTIAQTSISTTADTTFIGGTCATIAEGSVVAVAGTASGSGALSATRVFVIR